MMSEDTIYDHDEATELDESANKTKKDESASTASPSNEVPINNPWTKGVWKKVALGTGTGIVFGTTATILTSAATADGTSNNDNANSNTNEEVHTNQQPLVDDGISMATCVEDEMSFSQAFAAARAEVGPGGAFGWHGQIYGTYTAEEWDHMTAEERADYNNHFAWSSHSTDTTQTTTASSASTDEVHVVNHETAQQHAPTENSVHAQDDLHTDDVTPANEVTAADHTETEVEVLGVVHDADSDMNIGAMVMDGQEVVLIDVDNDMVFDVMASDFNGDGQFQENEMADISNQNLTVNDLGGITNPSDNLMASTDDMDYINDGVGYES